MNVINSLNSVFIIAPMAIGVFALIYNPRISLQRLEEFDSPH